MRHVPSAPRPSLWRRLAVAALLTVLALVTGCATGGTGGGGGGGESEPDDGSGPDTVPVYGRAADYTYELEQSSDAARVWTTPTCVKVYPETTRSPVPESTGSEIRLFAAANESEAFQFIVWAGTATGCTIQLPDFGIRETVTLHRVGYVPVTSTRGESGLWPDPLIPIAEGVGHAYTPGQNQAFWVTVRVPEATAPGDYSGNLGVQIGARALTIPVRLHVYAFTLPRTLDLGSLVECSYPSLLATGPAEAEDLTRFWYDHRLNPSVPTLPASLADLSGVSYNCATASFDDTAGGATSLATLGARFLDGTGWNSTGFPSFVALRYADETHPRPETFCGEALGADPYGSAAYNLRWQAMLTALDTYLGTKGWSGKALYQVAAQPTDAASLDLAAYLSETARAVAPGLRLAIASPPRDELTDHATYTHASFDLWMPSLAEYAPAAAAIRSRQTAHGEQVFWRLSAGEATPYPAPVAIDVPGLGNRLVGFAAFDARADGLYLPETTSWPADPWHAPGGSGAPGEGFLLYPAPGTAVADGPQYPSIRLELLREALEDYEYLILANGRAKPSATGPSVPDASVRSAVSGLEDWTDDAEGFMELRKELGRYVAGERSTLPLLTDSHGTIHPSATYRLNFQDPHGQPSANPLVVGGKSYTKAGWEAYDATRGYGWTDAAGATTLRTEWIPNAAFDALRRSILWDTSGTARTFAFALDNGTYDVTVSVGWAGRRTYYAHQSVAAEGVPVIEPGLPELSGYLERTVRVTVADEELTLRVGGVEANGKLHPTLLNYLVIVPAG
jgi:hypothetical protein